MNSLIAQRGLGTAYKRNGRQHVPDTFGPRVRFAWGYNDGAVAERDGGLRPRATGYDNVYIAGAEAGSADVRSGAWDAGRVSVNRAWAAFLRSLNREQLELIWRAEFVARYDNLAGEDDSLTARLCREAVREADLATLLLLEE